MQKLVLTVIFMTLLGSCGPGRDRSAERAAPADGSSAQSVSGDLSSDQAVSEDGAEAQTGMLILGSADKNTLVERVKMGFELYTSPVSFDYIIVSGGCGAHGSDICEAAEMAGLLVDMGVPASKIHKEENAKSTVQNYCFSRELRADNGAKLIGEGDSLYVVSSHWHAIPVAARFKTYDRVHATYYIKGNILPSKTDKTDYTNIYDNGLNSEEFCNQSE